MASEGLGLPDNLKDNFLFLQKAGVIQEDLTKRMVAMTGFRNIAVHEYQEVDVGMLKSILTKNLIDLEEFYTTILRHFRLAE